MSSLLGCLVHPGCSQQCKGVFYTPLLLRTLPALAVILSITCIEKKSTHLQARFNSVYLNHRHVCDSDKDSNMFPTQYLNYSLDSYVTCIEVRQ